MQKNTSSLAVHRSLFGFTSYQWLVMFAAWLGWGFDVFDALLFNYVSRLCIPSLLGPGHDDPSNITRWTGIITSVLLVGWGMGGILFGKITDRFGRTRTLMLTMLTYAVATAGCAFVTNIWMLVVLRFIASLGIGGEWAAGASLVAETVPENKRVQAGAFLYTSAPAGLFLATFVTDLFTHRWAYFALDPELSWRIVFLTGLIPAAIAILIRMKVHEPEIWLAGVQKPRLRELFIGAQRRQTVGGLAVASIALIAWWSCSAFLPIISSFLAIDAVGPSDAAPLKARFITVGTTWFNVGGLIGTLLTIPLSTRLGRRPMFLIYFALSAVFIWGVFRLDLEPHQRLAGMFFLGLTVFGVFGAFTFYLPELFPTRLRGTGSGFCYNAGRLITAVGPFVVGSIAQTVHTSEEIMAIVSWVAVVPVAGVMLVLLGVIAETKGISLETLERGVSPEEWGERPIDTPRDTAIVL